MGYANARFHLPTYVAQDCILDPIAVEVVVGRARAVLVALSRRGVGALRSAVLDARHSHDPHAVRLELRGDSTHALPRRRYTPAASLCGDEAGATEKNKGDSSESLGQSCPVHRSSLHGILCNPPGEARSHCFESGYRDSGCRLA